jgi:hypothetical protein
MLRQIAVKANHPAQQDVTPEPQNIAGRTVMSDNFQPLQWPDRSNTGKRKRQSIFYSETDNVEGLLCASWFALFCIGLLASSVIFAPAIGCIGYGM